MTRSLTTPAAILLICLVYVPCNSASLENILMRGVRQSARLATAHTSSGDASNHDAGEAATKDRDIDGMDPLYHLMGRPSCRTSGYACSMGKVGAFVGDIASTAGLKEALETVAYKKEIIITLIAKRGFSEASKP